MFGGVASLPPPRASIDAPPAVDLDTVWEGYQAPAELLEAADWLLEGSPRATSPMADAKKQLGDCTGRAPSAPLPVADTLPFVETPPQQKSWRASMDSSHLTRVSPVQTEGVESWLAGWSKLAEEQGCAVSPPESSTMQALLQRMASPPSRRTSLQGQERPRRPPARASCDFGTSLSLPPLQPPPQWAEAVGCYQQCSAPQPALSDGGSNSAGHGPSGDSSYYRNSEELHSGYNHALGSGVVQQGSPCRLSGRPPQAQLRPPHPALQQQYGPSQAACNRRQAGSIDLGARPRVPRPRSSLEAWGENGAVAASRADALASVALRAHKRKSEEALQPLPASHARRPASTANWRVAMGSSFYSSSAPLPVQPQAQAEPEAAYSKLPPNGTDPYMAVTPAPCTRATTPAAAPGYGVATPPSRRSRSFDHHRVDAAPGPNAPPAVRGTSGELACGSFLHAMQELAAAAPLVTQPFHQQAVHQSRPAAASPCVFSMQDWNEMLPDELLTP